MNTFYPAYKTIDREIGWLVTETGRIFLAFSMFGDGEPPLGIYGNEDLQEDIAATRSDNDKISLFSAIEYTKEVDSRIKEIIDGLITIRLSHPHLVQLELVLDE